MTRSRCLTENCGIILICQSLVIFIRKRDPRYIKEAMNEAKLQASLLAASRSQAARAKASFQGSLEEFHAQSWMGMDEASVQDESQESESEVEQEFECVACKKRYKNERSELQGLSLISSGNSSRI
jgi:DnaJ homolog subfamily A member 5